VQLGPTSGCAPTSTRHYPGKALPRVRREAATLGGVPVWLYTPPQIATPGTLLFFHGGSHIFGSAAAAPLA
jgi:acetyl esterase/lipase